MLKLYPKDGDGDENSITLSVITDWRQMPGFNRQRHPSGHMTDGKAFNLYCAGFLILW